AFESKYMTFSNFWYTICGLLQTVTDMWPKTNSRVIRLLYDFRLSLMLVSSGSRADCEPGVGGAGGAALPFQAGECAPGSGQTCWQSLPAYADRRRPTRSAGAEYGSGAASARSGLPR